MTLLDAESVQQFLRAHDLVGADLPICVTSLAGGVSSVVLAVSQAGRRMVVKQARERLQVADQWIAPPERSMVEADALAVAAAISPGHVPRVFARDAGAHILVLECAPSGWRDWRTQLLEGIVDIPVSGQLGTLLASWHTHTMGLLPESLRSHGHWDALRVDPYYRTVASRRPLIAESVSEVLSEMGRRRVCMVHGDFSPKNILVGDDGLWVIDFEVAHLGDPTFDVAFLLSHLVLKSIHLPEKRALLDACITTFLGAYATGGPTLCDFEDPHYLFRQTGCLLVARVVGKSPVDYLTHAERVAVETLGTSLIVAPPPGLGRFLQRRDEVTK